MRTATCGFCQPGCLRLSIRWQSLQSTLKDGVSFAQVVMVGSENQLRAPGLEPQVAECFDEILCSHTCFVGVSGKRLSVLHIRKWVIIKCFVLFCAYGHNVYRLPAAFIPTSVSVIAACGSVEQ